MATNPNNAVGTNAAYGGRASVKAFNDVLGVFNGRGILSGWVTVPSSGMTVAVGGNGSIRDVAIAENNTGDRTTINNISENPVPITIPAAPASNSRYDLIVAYVDNPPNGVPTVADNPGAVGIIVVSGTAAASPTVPSDGDIRSAITVDGGSGATAYYVIIATVLVTSGTTDITSNMITAGASAQIPGASLVGESVTSDKIDSTTLFSGNFTMNYGSSVTFQDDPTKYQFVEFYGQESGGRAVYTKIYKPSIGDRIILTGTVIGNNNTADSFDRGAVLQLSATGGSVTASGMRSVAVNGTITQTLSQGAVRLLRVIGYK